MRVTLDDVNESPPAFTMSVYSATIVEQSGADTSVLDVSGIYFSIYNSLESAEYGNKNFRS